MSIWISIYTYKLGVFSGKVSKKRFQKELLMSYSFWSQFFYPKIEVQIDIELIRIINTTNGTNVKIEIEVRDR